MSDWIEEANALADGELTGEEKARAQERSETDAGWHREVEWARTLRKTLADKCAPRADDGMAAAWKASVERLDALDRAKKAENFVGRYAWAMCAAFVGIILFAGFFNRINPSPSVSEAHLASVFSGLTPVPTAPVAEPREVREIVRQNAGRAAVSGAEDLILVGSASRVIDGRRAARFDFERRGASPVTLYVIDGDVEMVGMTPVPGTPNMVTGTVNGVNCVRWQDIDLTLILVGSCEPGDLVGVATALRRGR